MGALFGGAIKKPGQLHRDLHIPQDQKIPKALEEEAAHKPGKVGARARLALAMRGFNHK